MAPTLNLETAERQARELLDSRVQSVRELVIARQHLAELREQVATAERDDVRTYNAAVTAGWSPDELRKLGLTEPEKKARARRRSPARRGDATTSETPTASSGTA